MEIHLNPLQQSQQIQKLDPLSPYQRSEASTLHSSKESAAESSSWPSKIFESLLDSCSILYRFITSFFWSPTFNPLPHFKIPQLTQEKRNELLALVTQHAAPKTWFDRTASNDQVVGVLHQIFSIKESVLKYNETTKKDEFLSGKIFAIPSDAEIPFIASFENLDIFLPQLIKFLGATDTTKNPNVEILFSFCRIAKPLIGPILIDFKDQFECYNLRENKPYNQLTPLKNETYTPMKFFSVDRAQRYLLDFLCELSILH